MMRNSLIQRSLGMLVLVCAIGMLLGSVRTSSAGPQPPSPAPAAAETPPQPKEVAVPDLRELLARPQSELRGVTQWFEADRGSLTRFYTIPASPTRHARLQRFYSSWLIALDKLEP